VLPATIRQDIPPQKLRRLARLEADGRLAGWPLALADALTSRPHAEHGCPV
jgi:hypothetical protein